MKMLNIGFYSYIIIFILLYIIIYYLIINTIYSSQFSPWNIMFYYFIIWTLLYYIMFHKHFLVSIIPKSSHKKYFSVIICDFRTIFSKQHMYLLIPFSSKSTYCQRVSSPYQAEKIQPGRRAGGKEAAGRKKSVPRCAFLNKHSWWRGRHARAWQTNDRKWQTLRKHLSTTWC